MRIISLEYELVTGKKFKKTEFIKPIILIKGDNFSYKTVTLKLLDPKPITKEFLFNLNINGGTSWKRLKIEKDSDIFTLYSKVTKSKVTCSFKVNDEEKCQDGLKSTYEKLVEEYGLTILPIIDQRSSIFFDLTPSARKEYIQEKYIQDYDTFIELRELVKTQYKTLENKLAEVKNSLLTEMTLQDKKKELERLKEKVKQFTILESKKKELSQEVGKFVQLIKTKESELKTVRTGLTKPSKNKFVSESATVLEYLLQEHESKNYDSTLAGLKQELQRVKQIRSVIEGKEEILQERFDESFVLNIKIFSKYEYSVLINFLNIIEELGWGITGDFSFTARANALKYEIEYTLNALLKLRMEKKADLQKKKEILEEDKIALTVKEQNLIDIIANSTKTDIKENTECIKLDENCVKKKNEELEQVKSTLVVRKKELAMCMAQLEHNESTIKEVKKKISEKQKLIEKLERNYGIYKKLRLDLIDEQMINHIRKYEIDSSALNLIYDFKEKQSAVKGDMKQLLKEIDYLQEQIKMVNQIKEALDYRKRIEREEATEKELLTLKASYGEVKLKLDTVIDNIEHYKITTDFSKIPVIEHEILTDEEARKKLPEVIEDLKVYSILEKALSRDELLKILTQQRLLKLENEINHLIKEVFAIEDLIVSFQFEKKKLEITIKTKGGINRFETLSGAEQSIVKLATSLVITDEQKDIVRMDEISAFFDKNNRFKYLSFVENISKSISRQLFVIDHSNEFKELFNKINQQVIEM